MLRIVICIVMIVLLGGCATIGSAEEPLVTYTGAIKNEVVLPISMGLSAEPTIKTMEEKITIRDKEIDERFIRTYNQINRISDKFNDLEKLVILSNLQIDNIAFQPESPNVGDTVNITITITNPISSSISDVTVIINDQKGWGNSETIDIAPWETKIVKIPIYAREVHTEHNPREFKMTLSIDNVSIRHKKVQTITVN